MLRLLQRRHIALAGGGSVLAAQAAAASCAASSTAGSERSEAAAEPEQPALTIPFESPQENPYFRYGAYARRAVQAFLVKGRLVAYTSDVGESVRPVVPPSVVRACYGLTWAYVAADVGYNTSEAILAKKPSETILRTAVHATTFQVIASVAVPSFIIHQAVHAAQHAVHKLPKTPLTRWLPSVVGLCMIPFMPFVDHPIEQAVRLAARAGHLAAATRPSLPTTRAQTLARRAYMRGDGRMSASPPASPPDAPAPARRSTTGSRRRGRRSTETGARSCATHSKRRRSGTDWPWRHAHTSRMPHAVADRPVDQSGS